MTSIRSHHSLPGYGLPVLPNMAAAIENLLGDRAKITRQWYEDVCHARDGAIVAIEQTLKRFIEMIRD